VRGLQETFADVEEGSALAFIGSSGYLEIAVRGGSAAGSLGAETGEKVHVKIRS